MSKGTYQPENLFDVTIVQDTIIGTNLSGVAVSADDLSLIEQLRSGNEAAFVALIDRYATTMLRLAMVYVRAWAVAEEVVQETWMAILEGLNRFEGRSSLKTWMFRILTNCAITRARHEWPPPLFRQRSTKCSLWTLTRTYQRRALAWHGTRSIPRK